MMSESITHCDQQVDHKKDKKWLKRIGIAGFIFFLVKGLLWLLVPVFIYFATKIG